MKLKEQSPKSDGECCGTVCCYPDTFSFETGSNVTFEAKVRSYIVEKISGSSKKRKACELDKRNEIDGWIVTHSVTGPSKVMRRTRKAWEETDVIVKPITPAKLALSLQESKFINEFTENFKSKKSFKTAQVELISDPFQVSTVDAFLEDPSVIQDILEEIETIEFTRKQLDLYELYQTTDLANVKSHRLAEFYKLLNTDVRQWMEQLTGMKFKKISASCSMYNCGDFLLTHDDLLSDRLIAFVFYISPWNKGESWNESMGGALELFRTHEGLPRFPVAHKIHPKDNRFVFFKVEKTSFHQVGEVLTKELPRITINGWFHGFRNNQDYNAGLKVKIPSTVSFKPPIEIVEKLKSCINKTYLKPSIITSVQKQIEENSETALGHFLIPDFHEAVLRELETSSFVWNTVGPSNQQNYDRICLKSLPFCATRTLAEMMMSKEMFRLLEKYTELELDPKTKKPKCSVEIQRFKGGCYQMIPSNYSDDTLDLILYFAKNENVGVITYLTPEEDSTETQSTANSSDDEAGPVLLTIYPQSNFLNIVYRSQGTANFTKYCSKSSVMSSDYNYILFCRYKE